VIGMTTPEEFRRRAGSFGTQAGAYAAFRPHYPASFLRWALEPVRAAGGTTVLDLAAGTGKLTEGLLAQGMTVTAVEPDAAMLAELTGDFPDVAAKSGTAEAIPLPDASVAAVFVGQALHWFDLPRALPEITRVLVPGGPLVAAWNTYDDRMPYLRRLHEISGTIAYHQEGNGRALAPELSAFGAVEQREFPNWLIRTVDTMLATVATQSGILVLDEPEREQVLARVREVLVADPATANGEFAVPMITVAARITP
jgi:ubiquinone/menaquinone biosynthesis C-methylase UbiE